MTLKTKNIILNISSTLNLVTVVLLITILATHPELRGTKQFILLANSILVLLGTVVVFLTFKKSLPSEIILYIVFITSLSMQGIRILDQVIEFETFMISILIGRVSIFFKYLGLLALLGASLFSYSIKKQKIGSWIMLSMLGSGIIATIIHFNTGIVDTNLLPRIIYNREELVISLSIIFITLLTFIKSGLDSKNKDYLFLSLATLTLSLSLMVMFISLNMVLGVTILALLIVGSTMYLINMHNITLWG